MFIMALPLFYDTWLGNNIWFSEPGLINSLYFILILSIPPLCVYILRKPVIRRSVRKSKRYKNCKHINRQLRYRGKRRII